MQLETNHSRPFGLGYRRQRWPQATHHVLNVGHTECRVIVPAGRAPGLLGVLALLVAGLLLGR